MTPRLRDWLVVFVKAPSPGEVKSRMVPVLSPEEACRLYRALVRDTLAVVKRLRQAHPVVAYAANKEFPDVRWLGGTRAMFLQHGSTLGERLSQAFQWSFDQDARRVVVIGSDAPDLSASWIRNAFKALARWEVVVGPTVDGGYHLFGLTRPCPELFTGMPWSSPRLFDQTLQRTVQLGLSVRCLDAVTDLDTPADLRRYTANPAVLRRKTQTARVLRQLRRRHVLDGLRQPDVAGVSAHGPRARSS